MFIPKNLPKKNVFYFLFDFDPSCKQHHFGGGGGGVTLGPLQQPSGCFSEKKKIYSSSFGSRSFQQNFLHVLVS